MDKFNSQDHTTYHKFNISHGDWHTELERLNGGPLNEADWLHIYEHGTTPRQALIDAGKPIAGE